MSVRTRFAPSPTGLLHVGGVRTALFCWLYARRHGGKFILRVEDTDRERSTDEAVRVILDGMKWLGPEADEGPYYQTQRFDRYREVIQQMLAAGTAYRCYCTKEELDALRAEQMARKEKPRYDGRCRDRDRHAPGVRPGRAFQESPRRRGRGRRRDPRRRHVPEHRARRPDHRALRRHADLQLLRRRRRHGHGSHARDPRRRSPEQHAAADEHAARARRARRPSTRTCR